jgi:hypothetical protein
VGWVRCAAESASTPNHRAVRMSARGGALDCDAPHVLSYENGGATGLQELDASPAAFTASATLQQRSGTIGAVRVRRRIRVAVAGRHKDVNLRHGHVSPRKFVMCGGALRQAEQVAEQSLARDRP